MNETKHEITIYEDMNDWKVFVREKTALNHAASRKHPKVLKSVVKVTILESE